jgi:predicted  nucleic acid-binding Zn-ribbon protein
MALKLQIRPPMKSNMHNVVRQLIELHALEERLENGPRHAEEQSRAEMRIESLRASLPVGVLLTHDHMRAKGKRSVAEVRRLVCSGCHLTLGLGNVAALRRGEIHRCGHCGRYVYLQEGEEPAVADTPSEWKRPAPRKRRKVAQR